MYYILHSLRFFIDLSVTKIKFGKNPLKAVV